MTDEIESTQVKEESSSPLLWVMVYFVSLLMTAALFITMLFLAKGTGNLSTFLGGVLVGLIPGLTGGATFGGLIYAIHPRWRRPAIFVCLFGVVLPTVGFPLLVGWGSFYSLMLAPVGSIAGSVLTPWLVWTYRRKGMGKLKSPAGSWEDNF